MYSTTVALASLRSPWPHHAFFHTTCKDFNGWLPCWLSSQFLRNSTHSTTRLPNFRKIAFAAEEFLPLAQKNSPAEAKTHIKFAGTPVAILKSYNVEFTSKGGELDRDRRTLATRFTKRLRIASALAHSRGIVGTSESDGLKPSRKNFLAAEEILRLRMARCGKFGPCGPLALREETT